jgi:hypothetical protein
MHCQRTLTVFTTLWRYPLWSADFAMYAKQSL